MFWKNLSRHRRPTPDAPSAAEGEAGTLRVLDSALVPQHVARVLMVPRAQGGVRLHIYDLAEDYSDVRELVIQKGDTSVRFDLP